MENTSNKRPLKKALWGFLISMLALVALFLTQYLLKYSEDIFNKNLDFSIILQLILLVGSSFIFYALPISVLIMSLIYFREKHKLSLEKMALKPIVIPVLVIGLFALFLSAFITPTINLYHYSLLFDIRQKFPDQEMTRTDLSLFKGAIPTSNFFQLGDISDSLQKQKQERIENLILIIKSNIEPSKINDLVKLELAEKLGLTLQSFDISADNSYKVGYRYEDLVLMMISFDKQFSDINKISLERQNMLSYPLALILLFYIGLFLGILNRNNKLIFIVIGVFFVILPGYYSLVFGFDSLVLSGTMLSFMAQVSKLSILLLITVGLYYYAGKMLKAKE